MNRTPVASLIRPAILSKTVTSSPGEVFYGRMYAARAIPVGLLSRILLFRAGDRYRTGSLHRCNYPNLRCNDRIE